MKNYLLTDDWNIIEDGFHANLQRASESIFSIANGRIGQRANFEEDYDSDSFNGSYAAGVSFWEETVVGWWKNGFPHHHSSLPNSPNWSGIHVRLIDEELNLATWSTVAFRRELHLKEGTLERSFRGTSPHGTKLDVNIEHFNSLSQKNLSLIKYTITSVNYNGFLSFVPFIDANVRQKSAKTALNPWNIIKTSCTNECAYTWTQIKHENTQMCCACQYQLFKNGKEITRAPIRIEKEDRVGYSIGTDIKAGDTLVFYKYTSVLTTLYYDRNALVKEASQQCIEAKKIGYHQLKENHKKHWDKIWKDLDVRIIGDNKAQQAIRYNIFQLLQTYQGDDPRLNIPSKGFTGEKYGGNTYWNTELCCVPFMLFSNPHPVTKNLLLYRYNQLEKAIRNAQKLGFVNGAALYPMVTSNGNECHNEWEITFEEIHRNSIMVHAIDLYIRYTGDETYILPYGLEVMIAICRFWAQRVQYSKQREKYVILGVTGPNEYECNVNNNWYTNYSCIQTLKITLDYIQKAQQINPKAYRELCQKIAFEDKEMKEWDDIAQNMYLPEHKDIFMQDDGYLDKELLTVEDIDSKERPINQHWSWDRILRSCFIKQSDVLLGIYLYYNHFTREQVKNNFRFYEPRTLHESSLSPFVHSILAARIGKMDKAYEFFMRSARLDLDDYNNEVNEGLHITSMGGTWLAIVEGFAGLVIKENALHFSPSLPNHWQECDFHINFKHNKLYIQITQQQFIVTNKEGEKITLYINNEPLTLWPNGRESVPI